jgi:hypothetical protein
MNAMDMLLSMREVERLRKFELAIERYLTNADECREALIGIRDERLYRVNHGTFEAYCAKRWGITRQRAYQLIREGEVKAALPPKTQEKVKSSRALLALNEVPAESRERVVEEAAKASGGEATEASINAAAAKLDRENGKTQTFELDKTGVPIPDNVLGDWNRAADFMECLKQMTNVRRIVEAGLKEEDVIFAQITNTDLSRLKGSISDLDQIIPFAVCPYCQGLQRDSCTNCKRRGYMDEFSYNTYVPSEFKQMREKQAARFAKK